MGLSSNRVQNGLPEDKWGKCHIMARDVTFDSSYPTGGEALPPSMFGMNEITGVSIVGYDADAAPYVVRYNYATGKLMVFTSAGFTPAGTITVNAHAHDLLLKDAAVMDSAGSRVNAGTDLLGANTGGDITVAGAGANGGVQNTTATATFAGTAVAAAGLSEVANGTNLSALTVRVVAYGWA